MRRSERPLRYLWRPEPKGPTASGRRSRGFAKQAHALTCGMRRPRSSTPVMIVVILDRHDGELPLDHEMIGRLATVNLSG